MPNIVNVKSISQLHNLLGVKPPKHPAISFIHFDEMNISSEMDFDGASTDFYIISLKTSSGQLKYGRSYYDFEEGTLTFSAPNQVMYPSHLVSDILDDKGWSLIFHPDILFGTELGSKINTYNFFSYDVNEALHISNDEKQRLIDCIKNIKDEYSQNLDKHSQEIIVSNLELLLNYCKRFYDRQFITRKKQNSRVVNEVEKILKNYFDTDLPTQSGLPTVKYCADQVNLSPNYLSDLLKKETGKNTKEHIDFYLINKAKELLLGKDMSISEIGFYLGFEQSKSFSKLFKKRTGMAPREYRMN